MASKRVIPGLSKGLLGGCRGEIQRVTIPPALAYGEGSVDGLFPPDSTWIADVEIVDIVDSAEY
jgi:FKBP-type peptidyl-prolyl cis-trans isomerase